MQEKIDKIKKILISVPKDFVSGKFIFYSSENSALHSAGDTLLGTIQSYLKKYGCLYSKCVGILGPVISTKKFRDIQKNTLSSFTENDIILSIGSGPQIYKKRKDIINCDIFPSDNVDIVSDASNLPIRENCVDLIINLAMLEHVKDPSSIVSEMYRICKINGEIICYVPFIVPFHAAPDDYYRWTKEGAKELFKDFSSIEVGIGAGPTSALLWMVQEWLSLIFSFGNSKLKDIIFLILMICTFPIKYLDIILERFPNAEKLASGFYIYAKK